MRRVVVTGLGAVSPCGADVDTTWANVLAGKSGIGPITRFDASQFPSRIAGECRDFDPEKYIEKKRLAEGEHCKGIRSANECTEEEAISVATIQGVFSNRFQITGLMAAEAQELALLLRAGSLARAPGCSSWPAPAPNSSARAFSFKRGAPTWRSSNATCATRPPYGMRSSRSWASADGSTCS